MNIEKYFKENNIRSTRGRKSILKVLINSEEPLSAEYIYDICRTNNERVDLSTVYRTLELLEQKEVINKFLLDDGRYNFILKCKWHKHTIKCDFCHKEVEIDCPMIQIREIIKNKTGFTLLDEDFKFRCVCEECKKDNKS